MVTEFPLPDVGEGLAEAEIVRWLVAEGEPVREDDAIVEVETDKALVQITSPTTGTLVRHGAVEGDVVSVGDLLATFDDGADASADTGAASDAGDSASTPSDDGGAKADPQAATAATPAQPAPATQPPADVPPSTPARKPKATPATRKLARTLGVDLATVAGSGSGGRILDEDVQAAADGAAAPGPADEAPPRASAAAGTQAPPAAPAPPTPRPAPTGEDERIPLRGIRRAVTRTMTESWTTVPHVNSIHEVDLHELVSLRRQLAARDRKIPVTAFLVKAVALALREFPILNAQIDTEAEEIILKHRVNLGVAVDAPDGLMVPVIPDADRLSVPAIGQELVSLAAQARDRSVPQDRLRGGTFTVNNYGPLGGWFGTSLVKPPEVGILSIGPARDQVVPRDGEVVIRPVAVLTLAADHRVADGREVIGFCLAVRSWLESPASLLVEE